MDPQLLAVRRRLRDDYPFYAEAALKIRTKTGTIEPLRLNAAQRILYAAIRKDLDSRGYIRIIILKARQQGLSTAVGGYLHHKVSQTPARKAMVITHHADSTRALFDMTKRYHEQVPKVLQPSTKYSSRRELAFDVLDSSYVVATAGSAAVGRGETFTEVHASELAFWNLASAREVWNGLEQAVPLAEETAIFIESTANGVSGLFHELWQGAVAGTNGYTPVFIPWFLDDGYRLPVPPNFARTPDEENLVKEYGLTDEQLAWRRQKVAQNGLDLFKQEYPARPDEAFLTTGRPVFNPEQLHELLETAPEPMARLALEGNDWLPHARGELLCYAAHDPAETYYIGADVAMGVRGGDYSVAQVLDSRRRQVATYRAHVHPDHYATVLYALGMFYNEARIVVESNNHGILTCTRLGKDLAYPNVYTETSYDKITDRETVKLGFSVTAKSKPLIIGKLRAAIREREMTLNDKTTLREMQTYVVDESGAMNAEPGCHDDTVMALALANYINEGYVEPIAVPSEWYVDPV